jgi:hypothetical protein
MYGYGKNFVQDPPPKKKFVLYGVWGCLSCGYEQLYLV